jgi:hypothetical protein
MHLDLKNRPHNLIPVQGSPLPLIKFQMAPRLKLLISSGSKKRSPGIHVSVKPKLHIHREFGPRFHSLLHTSYIRNY